MRRKEFDEANKSNSLFLIIKIVDCFIEKIPDEILYMICYYFNRRDLINLMITCKKFYKIGLDLFFFL